MTEVRPASGHHVLRSRRRAVRSGMSVCLALAVIYSFGYPGSTPLTSGAGSTGAVLAQGTGSFVDADVPPTGFVGEQQLVAPETVSPFGATDSLVPGRVVPGTEETPHATADAEDDPAESLSTMARPGKGMLISPLQFLTPSSPFGLRTSPITGQHDEFHSGQDFAAPCGTRVFSADAGVVRAAGWHPWGGGNRVELDHGNGLVTTYNHLEGIAVEAGDRVGAGQVIASVGTTGWSTGCHLHFETILNGAHTDPSAWKLIPMDGSGPVEMPSLVNFTPGTGNGDDDDTAWVAYLASSEPIHPVAFKSPSRVDAEVAAQGKRSTAKASSSTKKTTTASSTPTTKPSGPGTSSPSTSTPGTSSPSPSTGGSTTTPPAGDSTPPATKTPAPPAGETPPATDPTPTPPAADTTPTPPTPPVTDPTPVVPDPTPILPDPTPIVPDPTPVVPDPTPIVPDPTPVVPDPIPTVVDPAPADPTITADPTPPVPDAATTAPPTVSAADPLAACDPTVDPEAIVVDPVTGDPVLDPVTGDPIRAAELCASATASEEAGAAGTEPAREPDPAGTTAP